MLVTNNAKMTRYILVLGDGKKRTMSELHTFIISGTELTFILSKSRSLESLSGLYFPKVSHALAFLITIFSEVKHGRSSTSLAIPRAVSRTPDTSPPIMLEANPVIPWRTAINCIRLNLFLAACCDFLIDEYIRRRVLFIFLSASTMACVNCNHFLINYEFKT